MVRFIIVALLIALVAKATGLEAANLDNDRDRLRAIATTNGRVVGEAVLKTKSAPNTINLAADRKVVAASRNDVAFVTVEIVDKHGNRVPDAQALLRFSIDGPGELAGLADGTPNQPASFQASECKAFLGRCLAILRPTGGVGEIVLRAESNGLQAAELTIRVESDSPNLTVIHRLSGSVISSE